MNRSFFQSFYPEGIFVIPEKSNPVVPLEIEKEQVFDVKFYGGNKQKILILVEDVEAEFIGEKDKEFLGKVLGAIKLTYNDVALVNTFKNSSLSFQDYLNQIDFTKLILFGKEPVGLTDSGILKYKISTKGDVEILHADILSEIQDDKNKKVKLWEELKKFFS
jgi:hypothetical protein